MKQSLMEDLIHNRENIQTEQEENEALAPDRTSVRKMRRERRAHGKTGNHGNALLMENSKRASTSECWGKREAESEWRKRGRKER